MKEWYRGNTQSNIPIIAVVSPHVGITAYHQKYFNEAESIATEYDIPFYNANLLLDTIGIDYIMDVVEIEHLNYRGNQKFTRFMGDYIEQNYEIPDHRGDSDFATWQRNADYIRQLIDNQKLIEATDLRAISSYLTNPEYDLFIASSGNCKSEEEKIFHFY